MEIITGEMDGEKIVRAETVFDKMDKIVNTFFKQSDEFIEKLADHDCHASPEDGCDCGKIVGDRVGEINGVDSDDYRDNEEDR